MPEKTGAEERVRRAFRSQGKACEELDSPFMARLCRLAAERLDGERAVGSRVLSWEGNPRPEADSVPLRLCGALHALVLSRRDDRLTSCYPPNVTDDETLWAACEAAFRTHADFILERLTSAPQTNEVRRSGALLAGFLTVARGFGKPLVLSEVGASAGLNLHWDRYGYDLSGGQWGDMESGVVISPQWSGAAPPDGSVEIVGRAGCDINPLDPASEEHRLRLLSYIWADQPDRLERTRNALAIAAAHGNLVERRDAVDWLKQRLAHPFPGAVHVVYHSVAWQYLSLSAQQEGEALIAAAGRAATADAPLAWLQMEADGSRPGAALTLQTWPGGGKHLIGRADFHGRWIEWTGLRKEG
ncbi:DUF2332 domain-containing protein [Sinorhizobium terangae]|uniref:DUF2332 family protein n=1 Tax=Sinorhizobium terangae TaxID=110322 RepID=A0A6N7LF28_SINTE|nr:DUF2332 family protein [Sinorhizobium terangae]MBB4186073.1 hypothetical protein [Sinorhizobium terangae]MQX15525.1 DUF2332 family protein [Sinorhizobium terangae]WFU47058.1 DUF2332 family protein [Sinorhizobium terangae]